LGVGHRRRVWGSGWERTPSPYPVVGADRSMQPDDILPSPRGRLAEAGLQQAHLELDDSIGCMAAPVQGSIQAQKKFEDTILSLQFQFQFQMMLAFTPTLARSSALLNVRSGPCDAGSDRRVASAAALSGGDVFDLEAFEARAGKGRLPRTRVPAPAVDVDDIDMDVASATTTELVDALLGVVGTTSDGSKDRSLTASQTDTVVDILNRLEEIGAAPERQRPLEDDLIYGNYNVSYTLMGNRQYGAPAGGRFRTGLGALLFKTTGLFQSVLRPDVVINKVALKIFRLIPAYVGLRGTLAEVPADGEMAGEKDTVKVFFEPPVLGFPGGIVARIGPSSTVVLRTTYVDDRVRIGKGSRGSLFVFTRGGKADEASMETVGLERTGAFGKVLIGAITMGMVALGAWVGVLGYRSSQPALSGVGWLVGMLGMFLAAVFVRGGIIDPGADDKPDVTLGGGKQPQPSAADWIANWKAKQQQPGGDSAKAWIDAWRSN